MLSAGTGVILRLGGLPDLSGKIMQSGHEVSIHFTWDTDAAPRALLDWIQAKRAA
jgi:hypothetical protein